MKPPLTWSHCSPADAAQTANANRQTPTAERRRADHNRLHAADVLHAVYYLTSQPIDNFCQVPLDLIDHYDNLLASTRPPANLEEQLRVALGQQQGQQQTLAVAQGPAGALCAGPEFANKLHNHIVAIVVAAAAAAADSELPFGIMGANLTALEVMALYTAAAMHDFQHPGRTNSFLVATSSPLVSNSTTTTPGALTTPLAPLPSAPPK